MRIWNIFQHLISRKRFCVTISVALLCLPVVVQAQTNYSIGWFSVDAGGGTSTGGLYSVSGTIGQPEAGGPIHGGNFSLVGGYWSLFAVPTPDAPQLRIHLVNPTTVTVSWPSPSVGFVLQENQTLTTTNWTTINSMPDDDGTNRTVTVMAPVGYKFYRLKRQN